jgi:hypothetical protein
VVFPLEQLSKLPATLMAAATTAIGFYLPLTVVNIPCNVLSLQVLISFQTYLIVYQRQRLWVQKRAVRSDKCLELNHQLLSY